MVSEHFTRACTQGFATMPPHVREKKSFAAYGSGRTSRTHLSIFRRSRFPGAVLAYSRYSSPDRTQRKIVRFPLRDSSDSRGGTLPLEGRGVTRLFTSFHAGCTTVVGNSKVYEVKPTSGGPFMGGRGLVLTCPASAPAPGRNGGRRAPSEEYPDLVGDGRCSKSDRGSKVGQQRCSSGETDQHARVNQFATPHATLWHWPHLAAPFVVGAYEHSDPPLCQSG